MFYLDDDGDCINISNQADLNEAYEVDPKLKIAYASSADIAKGMLAGKQDQTMNMSMNQSIIGGVSPQSSVYGGMPNNFGGAMGMTPGFPQAQQMYGGFDPM